MTPPAQYDVIVLGSGFGGSLLATILARSGMSVALIDRARHPRFTIGESSTPAADFLLQRLISRYGLTELQPLARFGTWREAHPEIACGCKRGFSYFWHAGEEGFQASQHHSHELLVAASASQVVADTHWYRPDVDQFFAKVARQSSVTCIEEGHVVDVNHPREGTWLVPLIHRGQSLELSAAFLVDATGPRGLLLQKLGVPDGSHLLQTRSSSVYGHWDDVPLLQSWLTARGAYVADHPYPAEDAAVHHLFSDGWMWQLRFETGRTSLGYVSADAESQWQRESAEQTWAAVLQHRPVLRDILHNARLAEFPGRLFQTGRLQRLKLQGAGPDWAALPSTVGFIDPLHSTGIAHTLSGVERLSRLLLKPACEERQADLARYSATVVNELRHIDRLVAGNYRSLTNFRLFTAWTMVYFAAATSFERRWLQQPDHPPGFLCADDPAFVDVVELLSEELLSRFAASAECDESEVDAFCRHIELALQPFNHVGLFHPQCPNMYWHTAASKLA